MFVNGLFSTHRGAVGVGQRERDALGGVDQRGPGQLSCYFSLNVFLKVCVDFKDSFNPSVREDSVCQSVRSPPDVGLLHQRTTNKRSVLTYGPSALSTLSTV